ncbi:MAG: hypothetical protein ABW252_10385 [Polyangiales bacterium]
MIVQRGAGASFAVLALLVGCDHAPVDANAASTGEEHATPHHEHAVCTSTWAAIQRSVFEAKSCTASACHSARTQAGALDLSSHDAYAQLVHQPAVASLDTPMVRVLPGEQAGSFLYAKLAAATEHASLPSGGGAPMPVGAAPLTADQLAAVKLWIRAGAPETGVVEGTQALLDCAQPSDADPNKTPRPPVPPASEGFQLASGPWPVAAGSETEVCFATYYDLTDSTPAWAKVPCTIGGREQTCVGYIRRELSQDAQSHHSIIGVYAGDVPPSHSVWGKWRCAGGAHAGAPCDPSLRDVSAAEGGAECGENAVCQTPPMQTVGCVGYGPKDKESYLISAGGGQAPVSTDLHPPGVYGSIPVKGVVLWDSHGFNLTKRETTIDQYLSFWHARPAERRYPSLDVFAPPLEVIDVPPFEEREYCGLFTLPQHGRLSHLSSHAHKRAVEFRAWLPPNPAACPVGGCMPDARTPVYRSTEYDDPVVRRFSPQPAFDDADPASRTLKFCARFDNGKHDPALLRRASRLPVGASCVGPRVCAFGARRGAACDRDEACGEAGACDACAVRFGVTTEDEMLYLLGTYYVAPPDSD